jgi:hypothetical protein
VLSVSVTRCRERARGPEGEGSANALRLKLSLSAREPKRGGGSGPLLPSYYDEAVIYNVPYLGLVPIETESERSNVKQ